MKRAVRTPGVEKGDSNLHDLTPTLTPTGATRDGTWRSGVQGEIEETAYLRRIHGRGGTRRRIGYLRYKEEVAGSIGHRTPKKSSILRVLDDS